jgi:hypothetical protein
MVEILLFAKRPADHRPLQKLFAKRPADHRPLQNRTIALRTTIESSIKSPKCAGKESKLGKCVKYGNIYAY